MITSASQTLAAIDAKIVASQEEPFRRHLGASVIGDECARKLWYLFHWVKAESFEARMLRLFNRGHLEEKRFIGYLRSVGVEVWEAGESGDMKAQMRFSDHAGHFGGTPDGVGRGIAELGPDVPFLLEFKTHNAKSFAKLQSEGLVRTKWKHFVQCQVCMTKLDLQFAVYCAVNKDDDALFIEIISNNGVEGPRAIERAGRIIWAKEPPPRVNNSPAHFACKFCHLARLCHFGDVQPERNCRTCQWSRPDDSGSGDWLCFHPEHDAAFGDNVPLNEAAQRAACPSYEVNPLLQGRQP
jgi:hypothetical protein